MELDAGGTVIGFAEKPSRAGFRPDECRHVRVPSERARRDRRPAAAATSAMTCCRGWWAGRGPCWSRGTSATSALPTHTGEPGRSGPRGPCDDHHPDALAHRPARRRNRPARLLPRARRPGPELRDRQVRLRHREAALRRRHLRQLLQEGDRLARRGPGARARPRGHADDRRDERGRDHHAGRHPVGGLRSRVLLRGDRRPAARAVRLPGTAGVGGGAGRAGLHDRDRALREAHRQAGPVHRRVRRDPRHPLRARR